MVIDRKIHKPLSHNAEDERQEMVRELRDRAAIARSFGDLKDAAWFEKTADELAQLDLFPEKKKRKKDLQLKLFEENK